MRAYDAIARLRDTLIDAGCDAVAPEFDRPGTPSRSEKRAASLRHFHEIRDRRTTAILVVNEPRGEVPDYIGANTFAEVAIAVADEKPVFVLYGIPDEYRDELTAWRAQTLDGNITALIHSLSRLRP